MKTTTILTTALLALATATAQAQQPGTTKTMDSDIGCVCVKNRASVSIVYGNEMFVRNEVMQTESLDDKAYNDYFAVRGDTLFIGEKADMRQTFYITVQLDSTKPSDIVFRDKSEGVVYPIGKSSIIITAIDDSKVDIGTADEKLAKVKMLKVWTFDNAVVKLKPQEVAGDTVCLFSRNESSIYAGDISGHNLYFTPNTHLGVSFKENKTINTLLKNVTADFSWAFNNWSGAAFNPFKEAPKGYELNTTFTSYQLSLGYHFNIFRHKLFLDLGLGYESDVYKFQDLKTSTNNVGTMVLSGGPTLDAIGSGYSSILNGYRYYNYSLSLVTRSITLPITLKYRKRGFTASLSVIPGINYSSRNTGYKYKMIYYDSKPTYKNIVSGEINTFKCDVRLSVGLWNFVKVFFQASTVPLLDDSENRLYPFKFGFTLGRF